MTSIVIEEDGSVEIRYKKLELFVLQSGPNQFKIVMNRPFHIAPCADNSIVIIPQLTSRDKE